MKRKENKTFFIFIMIIIFALIFASCGKKEDESIPMLLDLGAESCAPCKMMAPILDELREEYEGVMDVVFIDVWKPENRQEAKKHGIRAIPTQIFFDKDGKELWRHTGFMSKEDILRKWKELGYDLKPAKEAFVLDDCADCPHYSQLAGGCSGK